MSDWINPVQASKTFSTYLKQLPTKGKLAWEYNPFRNYRIDRTMWDYRNGLYTQEELRDQFGYTYDSDADEWLLNGAALDEQPVKRLKGELCDFITNQLSFSLEHPVNIIPQYSYDGSVNLILNDGLNEPRLINTRFSTTGLNTYEIINRKGDGDTNIYDQGDQFDIDTSLYKKVNNIPKLIFKGVTLGGNLKCGNYHFYFKYTDQDGNETDFVAESGLVSVFIGERHPHSIHTGVSNENSAKQVIFQLKNIDSAYEYVQVYYSRSYSEQDQNALIEYKKVERKYLVNNRHQCNIVITGFDQDLDVTAEDINLQYNIIDSAKTQATAKGMLFLANVHKQTIPYEKLSDLSLRFLPYLKETPYELEMTENYVIRSKNKGYYDPQVIYSSVGYWESDLYRLGIVYILSNNELSPVFNIRGGIGIKEFQNGDTQYSHFNFKLNNDDTEEDVVIQSDESTNYIKLPESDEGIAGTCQYENSKGVISLAPDKDTNTIHGIDIRVEDETLKRLRGLGIKGFFFVRQKRLPLTLCQALTIATDNNAHIPTLPILGDTIAKATANSSNTYMEYDSNPLLANYVSEGFMSKYKFKFGKKKEIHWKTIGAIAAIAALVVVGVVGSIFTGGAAGAGAAAGIAAIVSSGVLIGTVAAVAGAVTVAAVTTGAVMSAVNAIQWANRDSDIFNGRNTTIPDGGVQIEEDDSRILGADYIQRLIVKAAEDNTVNAALCPDYDVNAPYYNQLFTGIEYTVTAAKTQCNIRDNGGPGGYPYFQDKGRHYFIPGYIDDTSFNTYQTVKIQAVPDGRKLVMLEDQKFRSRAGWPEEAWRYESVGKEYKSNFTKINKEGDKAEDVKDENGDPLDVFATWNQVNSDIVRGEYGSYLGLKGFLGAPCTTINIMVPGYNSGNLGDYIQIRMSDANPYYAITDRIDLSDLSDYYLNASNLSNDSTVNEDCKFLAYRGDCYICQFTHRLNRNFQDPTSPYNDTIVDGKTWKKHYNPNKTEEQSLINLGDVNAVQLGMWVTFRVRSQYNLNIRTLDSNEVSEVALMGHPRGFYPYLGMSTEGNYKHSDALTYNLGFSKSLSERVNMEMPDQPAIKNWYGTRIMYSDIQVTDAFRNSFRVFRGTTYRDYTRQYGEITKILNIQDDLLVIFEHGIAHAAINEKMVAAQSKSGNAYITSNNVLPKDLTIVSESFGTQWPDSVIQTPQRGDVSSIIFGVDTVAKKIWMYKSGQFKIISDFAVQKFLNDNITLGERELTPVLGIRNVKTVYNAFKQDVMFTFYDNLDSHVDNVWNLCYNIPLNKFITFYSWVPSFMENINNIPFSFNRDVSKWIAKLGISHANNSFAHGITLSNNIYDFTSPCIGTLSLSDVILPTISNNVTYSYKFKLERDIYGNYKHFEIKNVYNSDNSLKEQTLCLKVNRPSFALTAGSLGTIYIDRNLDSSYVAEDDDLVYSSSIYNYIPTYSALLTELYYRNKAGHAYSDYSTNKVNISTASGEGTDLVADLTTDNGKYQYFKYVENMPIYKSKLGKREMIDTPINKNKIVQLLNISCVVTAHIPADNRDPQMAEYLRGNELTSTEGYYNVEVGTYKSTIAVTSKWNTQFLTSDFWKHGQAGLIDIADDIYPTYWYGEQHPFEFECVVIGDSSQHKIFRNLEIIANKAEPESFHYEIVGEAYDFAKDKPNMYFRQEARKALFQYNGVDITYNKNFLTIQPRQQHRSAELISYYFERQDTINEIYDYYASRTAENKDYRHLSGAEITYYPYRQEFRIWHHVPAINLDNLDQDNASNIIRANCQYLEDKWRVTINPILIAYKNEYVRPQTYSSALCVPENSTWVPAYNNPSQKLPPITIYNTNIPQAIQAAGQIDLPAYGEGSDNAIEGLYTEDEHYSPVDTTNWLNNLNVYNFGEAQNRKEIDVKDRFMKVRIRYSGKDLAVIDFLNTIYEVSYA